MKHGLNRRPRLALPFTILQAKDTVKLIAGEDLRYTFTSVGLETWLPRFLRNFDGRTTVDKLLYLLDSNLAEQAIQLINQLYEERILVDGIVEEIHQPHLYHLVVEGKGHLYDSLKPLASQSQKRSTKPLFVLCQDTLNYDEVLRFNARLLLEESPWLWVTYGPMSRGFVSPICMPDAGPCLACLIEQFRYLSPVPELYDELIEHSQEGQTINSVSFPQHGIDVLKSLALWKISLMEQPIQSGTAYRLHVLETDSLEVTTHRVLVNHECPQCRIK